MSKTLTMIQAVGYIRQKYGRTVTRMTIYNWANTNYGSGKRCVNLQTESIPNPVITHHRREVRVTTPEWIDEFFRQMGWA